MFTKKQNDLLTHTGSQTPLGRMMRQYWLPALLSEEIPEPDSPQVRVSLLGERLIAFRDTNGRIGLVGEQCSHRGVSLFYGRNEECGIRCGYHGWKIDVDGTVVDTPAEPVQSLFKRKVKHLAYSTHEAGGIIWAYLGADEELPAFPNYSWTNMPAERLYVTKSYLQCSWLQGLEGECDSAHLNFLHRIFTDGDSEQLYHGHYPDYTTEETDFGVRLIAEREADGENYVRVSSFVMPVSCWIPAFNKEIHMYVPIDDESCWRWDFGMLEQPLTTGEQIPRRDQIDHEFKRFRNAGNDYLIDRDEQRTKTFLGLGTNFLAHDAMATESMGRIYDRRTEHLGVSDKGVIAVRQFLLRAVEKFVNGETLPHVIRDPEESMEHIDTVTQFIPLGEDWHKYFPTLTLQSRK